MGGTTQTQHDLVKIHVLIQHEVEQWMITRDNPLLIAVGEELALPVFSVLYPPAVPYQPSLSMPIGNRNMGAPVETSADTCAEETSSAQTHVEGLAALMMGEDYSGNSRCGYVHDCSGCRGGILSYAYGRPNWRSCTHCTCRMIVVAVVAFFQLLVFFFDCCRHVEPLFCKSPSSKNLYH